jgi:hypothetical protein
MPTHFQWGGHKNALYNELGLNYDMKEIMNKFNLPIKRCNSDGTKLDFYGRKLLDICKYFSLIIFN